MKRSLPALLRAVALAALVPLSSLRSQEVGGDRFRWYIGPQAGIMIFETQSQTRGGIFTGGGNVFIVARRAGLMISVEEGIGNTEVSAYSDFTAPAGTCTGLSAGRRCVAFNDLRRYSAILLGFPLRTNPSPYLGAGFGLMQVVSPMPQFLAAEGVTVDQAAAARATAGDLGSHGFGSLVGGLQYRVSHFAVFGQYQVTTTPSAERLLVGPTHTFSGGIRLSLGSAKDDVKGGGY